MSIKRKDLNQTDFSGIGTGEKLDPLHPGEVLRCEFLEPMELTQYRLAKDIGVPARRINEIVKETRAISADTAIRLARYFGNSEQFWTGLQAGYDLAIARAKITDTLENIKPRAA